MRNAIRVGRLFGIDINLDFSWLLIFVLVTWSLADHYLMVQSRWTPALRWGLAFVTSILFFASVLAHELAHSLVSQAQGVSVRRITLFIFGGAAEISAQPRRARDEFVMALVGPLTSLALAALFGAMWFIAQGTNLAINAVAGWLAGINLMLAIFNLLPGFPLDGGRVLRAIVWDLTNNLQRGTRVAVGAGMLISWLFILVGVWQVFQGNWADGIWIAFIGWFLQGAAVHEGQAGLTTEALKGHKARELMMADCPHVLKQLTIDVFVAKVAIPSGRRCFPVMDGDNFVGLLTDHRIQDVPSEKWRETRVADVLIPPERLVSARPDEDLSEVVEVMVRSDVNQVPVLDNGRFVGMLTRGNILDLLRLLGSTLRADAKM